jgi:8-oxo-dGTP pyrophosphatase MutT (NUDIX family)
MSPDQPKAGPRGWTRVRRGEETDLQILRIREDTVEDGRTGAHYPRVVITCPDWVHVIPVTRQGEVVLVRQFRFGVWQDSLELPGGIIDPGEDPAHAALRELEEETGYRPAQPLIPLGSIHPNPALQTNRCHFFLAKDCEPLHGGRPDESEDLEVVLTPKDAISGLIQGGQISHALVAVAFYLEQVRR